MNLQAVKVMHNNNNVPCFFMYMSSVCLIRTFRLASYISLRAARRVLVPGHLFALIACTTHGTQEPAAYLLHSCAGFVFICRLFL